MNEDNKRRLISVIITLLLSMLGVGVLFVIALPYPDPPPPEYGVEMNMEELSDIGNDFDNASEGGEDVSNNVASNNSEEKVVSQDTEEAPISSKNTKVEKPKKEEKKPAEPTINQNALFSKGKVKKGNGGSQGISEGSGSGAGGNGEGKGVSFDLGGRGAKELVPPARSTTKTGQIVVEIYVDKEGNVVKVKAGVRPTTISDENLYRICEQAARKCKFAANQNAPELQKGTITYRFQ
ncbi:MAG: energy transducer TonB [Bacteroidales bacterium]|nr:energy transducer TonB [Bacteroidales bacterium]